MKWRVLPLEVQNPYNAIALDEVLFEKVISEREPIIRFWTWDKEAASIGRFQDIENELNLDFCENLGIEYTRRISGGGAMFHSPYNEIVYSIIAPEDLISSDVSLTFQKICDLIIDGLNYININSYFKKPNCIMIDGKKISGNSQRRKRNVLLQHGTVLYSVDRDRMFKVLSPEKSKDRSKYTKSRKSPVIGAKEVYDVNFETFYDSIKQGLLVDKSYFIDDIAESELIKSKKLAESKYKSKEWIFNR